MNELLRIQTTQKILPTFEGFLEFVELPVVQHEVMRGKH